MTRLERLSHAVYRTEPLDLGDFDEAYRGVTFDVWVTPTKAVADRVADLQRWIDEQAGALERGDVDFDDFTAALNERWYHILAELWRDCEIDEVRAIHAALQENNPLAWDWLIRRTHEMVREYRERVLKNSATG